MCTDCRVVDSQVSLLKKMCTSENAYFVLEHQSSYGNVPVINDSAGITHGKGKVSSPTSFPSDLQETRTIEWIMKLKIPKFEMLQRVHRREDIPAVNEIGNQKKHSSICENHQLEKQIV
ncbi:hypothetical protein GJ496_003763 [Pomphorhynchus laevis]|nr:hypothetical protein GJ496_003763 [Pomphorhynchus laevis]